MNDSDSPLDQCDMKCDGDSSQICDGGNRILVSQNTDWTISERIDLANKLGDYSQKSASIFDAI